eukprot:9959551-Ditylum_brightwellii.AAC.1
MAAISIAKTTTCLLSATPSICYSIMQVVHALELHHHSNLVMEEEVGAMWEEEQEVNPSLPLEAKSIQEEEVTVEEEDVLVEEFQTPTRILLLQIQHHQITRT